MIGEQPFYQLGVLEAERQLSDLAVVYPDVVGQNRARVFAFGHDVVQKREGHVAIVQTRCTQFVEEVAVVVPPHVGNELPLRKVLCCPRAFDDALQLGLGESHDLVERSIGG